MLSIVGFLLGIALFITLACRRWNAVLCTLICSLLMALFSGMGLAETLLRTYLGGLAAYLKSYFLMLLLSALLGRLLNDGGAARKIAQSLAVLTGRCSRGMQRYVSVLLVGGLYFFFAYLGISGYVMVFTVMPIALHLFHDTDTPWRLFFFGGAQSAASAILAGSLNQSNLYAAHVCGTATTAGTLFSLVILTAWWAVTLVLIWLFLRSAGKRGEGFSADGSALWEASRQKAQQEVPLPGLFASLLPMGLVLLCTAGLKMSVNGALALGCLTAGICLLPGLKSGLKGTIKHGILGCCSPALTVAALYGFGSVVKQLPSFALFTDWLDRLPGLAAGSMLAVVSGLIMAASPIPVFGEQMLAQFTGAGLSPALAHRMMSTATWACIAPHNAGVLNASHLSKVPYGRCLKVYLISTYVPGVLVTLLCIGLLMLGWFR